MEVSSDKLVIHFQFSLLLWIKIKISFEFFLVVTLFKIYVCKNPNFYRITLNIRFGVFYSLSSVFKDRKVLLWITLVLTYLLTYKSSSVQVIFRRSHPTLKLIKQKMFKILQVNVSIFLFCRNPKNDKVRAKKTILGPKNLN